MLSRLRNLIGRYVFARSASALPFYKYLLLNPVVFAIWFHGRRMWWRVTGHKFRTLAEPGADLSEFVQGKVLPYNLGNLLIINRDRTERLMLVLRGIRGFSPKNAQMIVIGPRNEAELLLLSAHGFKLANLSAIDLFSYSPRINLMDMHKLQFAEDSFDAVYSAFVITYSDDIPRAVREAIRVAKDGAICAFAFEHLSLGSGNLFGKNNLSGGPRDLLAEFGEHVAHTYWTEDFEREGRYISSVIFRLTKSRASAGRSVA